MKENLENPIYVLIPAGGSGVRFGSSTKKQFLKLAGKPILHQTIQKFIDVSNSIQVIAALPEEELEEQRKNWNHPQVQFVAGGKSRAESVYKAFSVIQNALPQNVVMVHDAVRPLISKKVISRVIESVQKNGPTIPGVAVTDTIKKVSDSKVETTLNRENLKAAQTPQGATYQDFLDCYDKMKEGLTDLTDEAMLFERSGKTVTVVEGDPQNIKITKSLDLIVAEAILKDGE